jgi:3'-5' exoribonuclease
MRHSINQFREGEQIKAVMLLKKKELGKTKNDKPYLKLEFADKSGTIEGRMWEVTGCANKDVETGSAVLVTGSVTVWRGSTQLNVDDLSPAPPDSYTRSDLVRCVDNIEKIISSIQAIFSRHMKNPWGIQLIKSFFEDESFMTHMKKAPGARSWHNAYVGGLLEHTYEVLAIVEKMFELYPEINKDVALIGAFLHDSGKMLELDPETFEYTHDGSLIGHITIGYELLSAHIQKIPGFPEDLARHLKHILLSHHGEYEQQSPVLPKTLEAVIVYHADNLVSQANAVREIMKSNEGSTNDWSNFITIKNRKFFLQRVDNPPAS